MTMIDSITTSLRAIINNTPIIGVNFYLFGSATISSKANDIDLLIEYDENIISIKEALRLRVEIAQYLDEEYKIPIDICLLSNNESFDTNFIYSEKGVLIVIE